MWTRARRVGLFGALYLLAADPSLQAQRERDKPRAEGEAAPRFAPELFAGMRWRSIGPPRGGRSNASTGVPSQPGVFYFGGVGSGVWKTTDHGETWRHVSDAAFKTSSVGAIAVAPSDSNVVYAGMGEHAIRGVMTSHGDGVYRSTDAGATWQHRGLEATRQIAAVVVDPRDPDLVYVAAQGSAYSPSEERGVYRSRDGGASWQQVLYVDRTAGAAALSMDPNNPRVLYAAFWDHLRTPWQVRSGGPGSGLWKTTDGGERWERVGETVEAGLPERKGKLAVAVSADPRRVYALVEADPKGGLYRSDDGGKNWRLTNESWGIRARAWYYIKVYADPQDPDTVWISNADLYKSIDGGKTFDEVRVPHGDNHHLWIHPRDSRIMINSNDGGANVSNNGGQSWSTQRNQPTGQFYRVAVDHQFPYHVYGGQQDNSAIGVESAAPGGIGWDDFYSIGGCESAWAAFDPDAPRYVYGGCYQGAIEEWDRTTEASRGVMAYPSLPLATAPRDNKYRFNWSAPIVVSPHDSAIVYHAGNVVLQSRDRGLSWREISPDLSRNEKEKQGPGGAPITNEGAGGEVYGTVYAFAASRLERGVLWAGSDDGLVHVSRDDGQSWNAVTPPGIGDGLINALEASPHQPGKAYAAVTRYKFGDLTPLAFRTTDYGRSWQPIVRGIPQGAWVRVVREDPVRPGLLYLGTETGLFVSFDDGVRWQSLQLEMPVTPITDLVVQRPSNDLVASTAGYGFWILDNLTPLQTLDDVAAAARLHLFAPEPAVRTGASGFSIPDGRVGQNPPGVTTFDFLVPALPKEGEVTLELVDSAGLVVRRFRGKEKRSEQQRVPAPANVEAAAAGPAGDAAAEKKAGEEGEKKTPWQQAEEATVTEFELEAGMNRVAWDGRHRRPRPVPGLFVFGGDDGRRATPSLYAVRLRVGAESREQPLRVLADPRVAGGDYPAQAALFDQVAQELEQLNDSVLRLRAAREQIESFLAARAGGEGLDEVAAAGRAIVSGLTEVEDALIQKRTVDGQTVINFPVKLDHHYRSLLGAVESGEGIVTAGARERAGDLSAEWTAARSRLDQLLAADLGAFNELVRSRSVPAIHLPPTADRR